MATTFSFIAKATGTGSSPSMEFTNIPSTYTDLIIFVSGRAISAGTVTDIALRLNGVTSGYTYREIKANGSTVSSNTNSSTSPYMEDVLTRTDATINTFSNIYYYIPDYRGNNIKTIFADGVAENYAQTTGMALWTCTSNSTNVVSSITVYSGTGNFNSFSTAYLYGIKNS